jgi:hypothetical protein
VKRKYIKYLIQFLVLLVVINLLAMMNWIIFSDNPLTWGEFLRLLPFSVIAGLGAVISRAFLFMSPQIKKTVKRPATKALKK